tara:strand:+ start:530 stop:1087 length:558 start_codon:yes stop_codon:yes gene_type:complete
MPVNTSSICDFGWKAKPFKLPSVNNQYYSLDELKGENGTLIVFICNHCPYVISIAERLSYESRELKKIKINTIAIMSNDVISYPEDSFENMQKFSKKYKFDFQYLFDSNQNVAKQFNAVCTPDFFGFNKKLELQYRGRIDSKVSKNNQPIERELFKAMKLISETDKGPLKQNNSFGCSIKWKINE